MTTEAFTPTVRMVPIQEADLEMVAPLVNRAFGVYSEMFQGQRTSPSDYRDEAGEDARVILIEQDGRLLATAMLTRAEPFTLTDQLGPAGTPRPSLDSTTPARAPHPWDGALYFGLAGVEPEIMTRGLGRMMVNHFETVARAEGFRTAALGTVREFGLVDYYQKLSYQVTSEHLYPIGHWDFVVPHHHCEMIKVL